MDLKDTLNEALKGRLRRFGSNITQTKEECKYFPKDRDELIDIIKPLIDEDPECDLNDVWVGDITDMNYLFEESKFNGDVSRWDVSNVKNMYAMFCRSPFNGDISSWDVSNVKYMDYMFSRSPFNGDISAWNVRKVKNTSYMFYKSVFDGDLSDWNLSNIEYMGFMFKDCPLEKNPPKWYKG